MRAFAVVVMLVWAGCNERSKAIGPNGLSTGLEQLVADRCDRLAGCAADIVFDRETCARSYAALLCSVKPDRVRAASVKQCRAAVADLPCGSLTNLGWPEECEAIFNDSLGFQPLAADVPCGGDNDCASGLHCEGVQDECAGRCVPARKVGEACLDFQECVAGAICSSARVCEQPRSSGRACRSQIDCQDDCVAGFCASPAELWDRPCDTDLGCGSSLRCLHGLCASFNRLGSSCSEAKECFPGASCIDGRCTLAGTCGSGQEGDPCMAKGQCAGALACDQGERRCVPPPQLGDTCTLDLLCGADLACDFAPAQGGVCVQSELGREDGAECESFWQCLSGFCGAGRCEPPVACEPG